MKTVIDEALENEHKRVEEEIKWQTEADVRTLVEARRIMADPDRLERAETYLRQGIEQLEA
jgi:hypothetical protein